MYGPDFSLRPPHPPTPIITLYSGHSGKALSAAWTATKPPPPVTNFTKSAWVSLGQDWPL